MLKISHFLSHFQNGFRLGKKSIMVEVNHIHSQLCHFFLQQGLIDSYSVQGKHFVIVFKYSWDGKSLIDSFHIVSRKRVRRYLPRPKTFGEKHFLTVISTNQGLKTKDECFLNHLGGEELFVIHF